MARTLEKTAVRQNEPLSGEDLLEDYLEHLVSPLIGIVPFPERRAFRFETAGHIEAVIRENEIQGATLREATEAALREFGEPWLVGKSFLQEWLQGTPDRPPAPRIRQATGIAFAYFGVIHVIVLLMVESPVLTSPNDFVLPLAIALAFLSPIIAGGLCGIGAPAQAERGVLNAVFGCALHSLATGLLMLPTYPNLAYDTWILASWQLAFWLPAGRISAGAAATYLRHYWRQRYWRKTNVRSGATMT